MPRGSHVRSWSFAPTKVARPFTVHAAFLTNAYGCNLTRPSATLSNFVERGSAMRVTNRTSFGLVRQLDENPSPLVGEGGS